jgi:membrane-associated phospholipid phosphatase
MLPGTVWRESVPRPLLSGHLRATGTALLVICVAVIFAAFLAAQGDPSRLNAVLDPRIQEAMSGFPVLLNWLPDLGTLILVAPMTLVLATAFAAIRKWSGAVLAVVAVPGAIGLTEYVLKPYVGGILGQSFPSGHATSSFALATGFAVLLVASPRHRLPGTLRLLLVLMALLLATAVAAAMVAITAHNFTDVVAGAAVGTSVVLACALALDLVTSRAHRRHHPRRPAGPDPALTHVTRLTSFPSE